MNAPRIIAAVVLALALPAAARAQNREEMQVYADLRMLQEQVAKLQLSVNQLIDMNKALGKRVDDQADAAVRASANEQLLIKNQATALGVVQQNLNDSTVRVSELKQEVESVRKGLGIVTDQLNTLTNLLQTPVGPDASTAAAAPATGSPGSGGSASAPPATASNGATSPAPGPLAPISVPPSPEQYFSAAQDDYMANRLDNAIDGFTDFLQKFPDSPNAAHAQYYIGECYFQEAKYDDAIKAYDLVIKNYKGSDYVPQAYYHQGKAYQELNQKANAQRVFDIIVRQFPNSAEAALVRQQPGRGKD